LLAVCCDFDYNDKEAVQKQQEEVLLLVKQFKNNPAVLFWVIGNELDFIPPDKVCNPKVWDAVNSMALAIKAIDPSHPVMTVIGTSRMYKLADIIERCPALDLLGLNTYKDIYGLQDILAKWGWTKPYVIAEWGPSGYWEVKKTPWKAPFEQTSAEKAFVYRTIKPGDVRNIKGTEFVMYEHFSKTLKTAKLNDPSPVKLNRMGYQLFYVVPIQNGFAALGLTEKYNVPATILKETWNKNNVAITLYEGGSFKAYSAKRPNKIFINGKSITNYNFRDQTLFINVPNQKKPVISIYW
jgi:hypothetical protein